MQCNSMHFSPTIFNCLYKLRLPHTKLDWIGKDIVHKGQRFNAQVFIAFDWKCELFCKILWFIGSASNRLISYWKWPVYAISQTQLNLTEILIIIGESNCHYFHPNRNGIVIIAFADPYCNSNVITAQIFAEAHATRRW